jgi:hypothetical protein
MRPNFSGAWSADIDRCHFRMDAPKALFMEIAHDKTQIRQKILTTFKDGSKRFAELHYVVDLETDAVVGGISAKVIAVWQGAELVIKSRLTMQGREVQLVDYWSLSAGGTLLTTEHRDDMLAGQICVFERAASDEIDELSAAASR